MKVTSVLALTSFLIPSIAAAGLNNWSTIAYHSNAYQILCEVSDSEYSLTSNITEDNKYKLSFRHECNLSRLSTYISTDRLNSIINSHGEYATIHTQMYRKTFQGKTATEGYARAQLVGSNKYPAGSRPYWSNRILVLADNFDPIVKVGVKKEPLSGSNGSVPDISLPNTVPNHSYSYTDNASLILRKVSDNTIIQRFPLKMNITLTKRGWSSHDNCRIRLPNAITFTSRDQKEVLLETDGNCTSIWNSNESIKGSIKFIKPSDTDLQLSGISGLDWNKSMQPTGKIYLSPGKTKNGEYNINTEVTYP